MDDLISRQAAIDALDLADFIKDNDYADGETLLYMDSVIEALKDLPSAERKNGKWIAHDMSIKDVPTEACSECGMWSYGHNENYCSNCGAYMRGEEHEAD